MKRTVFLLGGLVAVGLLAGCETVPPGAERGPGGTVAYEVSISASEPDVKIEANGAEVGVAPLKLKIFGDNDGTFHDFGSYYYVIRAIPSTTNSFVQTRYYRTGRMFTPEDHIPQQINFDMSKKPMEYPAPPAYGEAPPPAYPYYYGPGPYYYGPPVYFGPRVYVRPGYHHWRHW